MPKFRNSLLILASLAFLNVSSTAFADSSCDAFVGNLIQNCGFETGDFTDWTKVDTTNYSGVDTHNPDSGNYAASLGAMGPDGTLSQTVTDVAGSYYALSFFLDNEIATEANGSLYPGGNIFDVSVTNDLGKTTVLYTTKNLPETGIYSSYEFFFFGTGSDTITFTYENIPSYFDLDDVILVDPPPPGSLDATQDVGDDDPVDPPAVPEPSSLVLLGTGVLSLAGVVRRRFPRTSQSA